VKGKVAIDNVLVEMEDLPADAYSESADTKFISSHSESAEASADALPWQMSADIEVFLGDDVVFRGFGADVHLAGRLRYLQQQQNFPLAEGEISITKGRYTFWGQRLDIKEGSFLFSGPLDSPNIKLEATRDIVSENLTVGIRGYGPIAEPKFDVFSSKAMSEQETMHYLLTGRGLDKKSAQGGDLLSAALLSKGVNNAGSRPEQLANKLGIEDFQMGTSSNEEGSAVQLSGYVSERIFVEYGVGLFDRTNAFILRYQLTEKLFVETASGIDSTIDLIYSFEHD
jgi:translocation and assembly module TamB